MRIFLAHGFRGNPKIPAWFPWLQQELESKGHTVFVPAFPSPEAPDPSAWIATIEQTLSGAFEDVVFIGHSLGGNAILRALEAHPTSEKAGAVFLAGTPFTMKSRPPVLVPFLEPPYNWERIRSRAAHWYHLSSEDDDRVPVEDGKMFHEKLGGTFLLFSGMKHFVSPTFPKILELVNALTFP